MPTPVQRGEIADGARAVARLTGRIPLQLDETVVLAANVADLDSPPYRLGPRRFASSATVNAVAAEVGFIAAGLPPGAAGSAILDELWIENATAAAATFRVRMVLWQDIIGTIAANNAFLDIERPLLDDWIATNLTQVAVRRLTGTDPVSLGTAIAGAAVPAGNTLILPLGVRIVPGLAVALWHTVVNLAVSGSWYGTYYPDL